jgi:hypothetical protein
MSRRHCFASKAIHNAYSMLWGLVWDVLERKTHRNKMAKRVAHGLPKTNKN